MRKSTHLAFSRSGFIAALLGVIGLLILMSPAGPASSQGGDSIRVQAPKADFAVGETFDVNVIQSSGSPTLGAQAGFFFNPAVIQVYDVQPGDPYLDAQLFAGVAPQTIDEAIAEANATGVLRNVATFYLPGTGRVEPGENVFAILSFQVVGAGATEIRPGDFEYTGANPVTGAESVVTERVGLVPDPPDELGNVLAATPVAAHINVPAGAAPVTPPPPEGSATPSPTGTPKPSKTPNKSAGATGAAGTSFVVEPTEVKAEKGAEFEFIIEARTAVAISGAQVTIEFDREVATVTEIELGEDWEVSSPPKYDQIIEASNNSGELNGLVIVQKSSAKPVPKGEVTLFKIKMQAADEDGESVLKLADASILDEDGEELKVTSLNSGTAIVGEGEGGGVGGIVMAGGGFLLLGGLAAGGYYAYRTYRKRQWEEE